MMEALFSYSVKLRPEPGSRVKTNTSTSTQGASASIARTLAKGLAREIDAELHLVRCLCAGHTILSVPEAANPWSTIFRITRGTVWGVSPIPHRGLQRSPGTFEYPSSDGNRKVVEQLSRQRGGPR